MAPGSRRPLWVIGWREWLELPDLNVPRIKVKVDTGAASSALHAVELERFRDADRTMVRFRVHPYQRDERSVVEAVAEMIDERSVRDSGGRTERRPVIATRARLRGRIWKIEMTLTRRDQMGFRMLLGRRALRGRFLVDPGRSLLAGKPSSGADSARR